MVALRFPTLISPVLGAGLDDLNRHVMVIKEERGHIVLDTGIYVQNVHTRT